MALAVQPALSSASNNSIPAAAARPLPQRRMSGKENLVQFQPPSASKRERPCDACRRRKSRCEVREGLVCVLCQFHKQDCTFLQDPQPRKRKVVPEIERQDVSPKRRCVSSIYCLARPSKAGLTPDEQVFGGRSGTQLDNCHAKERDQA